MKHVITFFLFVISFTLNAQTYEASKVPEINSFFYTKSTHPTTIQYILKNSPQWKEHNAKIFSSAADDSEVWIKFSLTSKQKKKYSLLISNDVLQNCDIYSVISNRIISDKKLSFESSNILVPMQLDGEKRDIYIHFKGLVSLSFSLKLLDDDATLVFVKELSFFQGIFFGILLFLFIHNFLNYFIHKSKIYLYYLCYMFGIISYFAFIDGYLLSQVWPFSIHSYYILFQASVFITYFGIILFSLKLLEVEKHFPKIYTLFMYFMFLIAMLELLQLYCQQTNLMSLYFQVYAFESIVLFLILAILLLISYKRSYEGSKTARYYAIAWTMMIVFLLNYILSNFVNEMDILNSQKILRVSIVIEGIWFSLILSYRLKEMENILKEKEKLLLDKEHTVQIGKMLSEISHQWRQPLNIINAVIFEHFLNPNNSTKEEIKTTLNKIEEQTQILSSTIDDFQFFYEKKSKKKEVNILFCIDKVLTVLKRHIEIKSINCKVDIDNTIQFYGVKSLFIQILSIIIQNAIEQFRDIQIDKRINIYSTRDADFIYLHIKDNAGGIDKNNFDKIFDRYMSTKEGKDNSGLGLNIAKNIIENGMSGFLLVKNIKNGVIFTIKVPYEQG